MEVAKAIDSPQCPNATLRASTTPSFWQYHQEQPVASRGGMQAWTAWRSFDGERAMPGTRYDAVGRPVITVLIGRCVSNHDATPRFAPRRRERRRRSWRTPI